jgi:hypothetical protein
MHRLLAYVQQIPSGQREEEFEELLTSSITHFYLIKKQQKPWALPNTDYSTPRLTQMYVLCYRTLVEQQSPGQNLAVIRSLSSSFFRHFTPGFFNAAFLFPSVVSRTNDPGRMEEKEPDDG